MSKIEHIHGRQIFDSRGNPTVEVDVFLEDGSMGRAAVPSGASTGSQEAYELRDGEIAFNGKGVLNAVDNVNTELNTLLRGVEAGAQAEIDKMMVETDGTENKHRLGANAILGVSLAVAKAEANSRTEFLYEYVQGLSRNSPEATLPLPMCNLINGGKHAAGSTDIQEFMILPVGAESFTHCMQIVVEVFHALKDVLRIKGYSTTVGDEGGFAPRVKKGNKEALDLLAQAVEKAGYTLGDDVAFGIDTAANELYADGTYALKSEYKNYNTEQMIDFYDTLIKEFPLISIEDGLHEGDWEGWNALHTKFGDEVQIVGDDLLVTNIHLLKKAILKNAANAILVKVNQIGTLTEAIETVDAAKDAGWSTIISHRSGETEDTTISHLVVGLEAGQIKAGSVSRSDRVAKYNELLRIEEVMGNSVKTRT